MAAHLPHSSTTNAVSHHRPSWCSARAATASTRSSRRTLTHISATNRDGWHTRGARTIRVLRALTIDESRAATDGTAT